MSDAHHDHARGALVNAPGAGSLQGEEVTAVRYSFSCETLSDEYLDINPWHGFAWLDALQRVVQGPNGRDYRQTSWNVDPA